MVPVQEAEKLDITPSPRGCAQCWGVQLKKSFIYRLQKYQRCGSNAGNSFTLKGEAVSLPFRQETAESDSWNFLSDLLVTMLNRSSTQPFISALQLLHFHPVMGNEICKKIQTQQLYFPPFGFCLPLHRNSSFNQELEKFKPELKCHLLSSESDESLENRFQGMWLDSSS